jgi:hypothetical protein
LLKDLNKNMFERIQENEINVLECKEENVLRMFEN